MQGFDNNVELNPDRKKDGFLETSLNTELTYNYTDDLRLKLENYTTDVLYYNVNDANILDIYNEISMETDLLGDVFTLGADYALESAIFPNDENGSYFASRMSGFLRHNIFSYLYQQIGYGYLYKWYAHDKTLHSDGYRTENLREDGRHIMDYEVGFYPLKRIMFKTRMQVYHNNANYEYFKYYDYWSFKIKPALTVMLTERLYANTSFSYRQRRYEGRLSSEDDEHVYDDTWGFGASALYDLTKSFTLVLNYNYRENASNEPLQKYSGSTLTGGVYYSF